MAKQYVLEKGSQVHFRLKKNESDILLNWLNAQDNISDSIRYLIEKEIAQNGINNLQRTVPTMRNEEYWKNFLQKEEEDLQELLKRKEEEYFQEMIKGNEEEYFQKLLKQEDVIITIQRKNQLTES